MLGDRNQLLLVSELQEGYSLRSRGRIIVAVFTLYANSYISLFFGFCFQFWWQDDIFKMAPEGLHLLYSWSVPFGDSDRVERRFSPLMGMLIFEPLAFRLARLTPNCALRLEE